MPAHLPLLILATILLLIMVRRIGGMRLAIWQIMVGGAVMTLASGLLTPAQGWAAIDMDVMLFLFGVFFIGQALIDSGYLQHLGYRLFSCVATPGALLALVILGSGLGSALLMNDTLAIIGTPLMVLLARQHRLPPQLLLLALAFAVTTGSVMSPIGNPQNLLIAVGSGMANPFVVFLSALALPTLLALSVCWLVLRIAYRDQFGTAVLVHQQVALQDVALARLARLALLLLLVLIGVRIALAQFAPAAVFPLTWIALGAAVPLLFHRRSLQLLFELDWATLLFFAALFIVMAGVWQSGLLQQALVGFGGELTALPSILFAGLGLSQLISNVPLVSLYLPLLLEAQAPQSALLALAAASTLAGNLLVLGAASNVIILQNAERDGVHISYWEFARLGVVVTLLQLAIFVPFLL